MKKGGFFSFLAAVVLLLSGCGDSEYEYYVLQITSSSSGIYYADQTVDTLTVVGTQDWTLTLVDDWLSLSESGTTGSYSAEGSYYYNYLPLYIEPNTEGATRDGTIKLSADKTATLYVEQYFYHNISRPARILVSNSSDIYADILNDDESQREFILSVAGTATSDYLTFTLYGDATLTTQDTWIEPQDTTLSAGSYTMALSFGTNYEATRKATYTLTSSNGAQTTIYVYQQQASEN